MARIHKIGEQVRLEGDEVATLLLTAVEAQVIADVLSAVGGSPTKTRRIVTEKMVRVFMDAGYHFLRGDGDSARDMSGNVFFTAAWSKAKDYDAHYDAIESPF